MDKESTRGIAYTLRIASSWMRNPLEEWYRYLARYYQLLDADSELQDQNGCKIL
jgi:hypothetical protein